MLRPILRRAFGGDPNVEVLGCNKHSIGIFETARGDTVDPNREGIPESGASLSCWADEVGDNRAACLDHPVAHPSHPACMLDPVDVAEPEIARDVRAHLVGVEHDRIEERCEYGRECRFARAR
jgi:hypothetical protein